MHCLLFITLLIGAGALGLEAANDFSYWLQVGVNLTHYRIRRNFSAKVLTACVAAATADTDAVLFSEQTGQCSWLTCLHGRLGCHKCRVMGKTNLQSLVWIRTVGSRATCWRTFQRRLDGSVKFNRTWTEYVGGFGQGENANFWMGLDALHRLTKDGRRRVRWEFSDWEGNWYWTENFNFTVANFEDNYRARMGAADPSRSNVAQCDLNSEWTVNGHQFSTAEMDHDGFQSGNSAAVRRAGWWFGYCNSFNPNGVYYEPPFPADLNSDSYSPLYYFYEWSTTPLYMDYSMRTVECLVEDAL